MNYAICIQAPPDSPSSLSAYRFIEACMQNHHVSCVFFYGDGVYNASSIINLPPDQLSLIACWKQLGKDKLPSSLFLCSTAATERGVISSGDDMAASSGFLVAGLGEWVARSIQADRVVVFK